MTNTQAKHTPGPWFIWNDKIKAEKDGWQQPGFIAEIPNHVGVEESANAHLISAAPELLEALEMLSSFAVKDHPLIERMQFSEAGRELATKIKAAIAKAKGEV